MIGLVIVTHARLAAEFLAALEHIVGPQSAAVAICIGPNDDMEARRQEIIAAIARVDGGKGVIVLTDMFGGTPSNLALSAIEQGRVEVIAGINLPILIKLADVRTKKPLAEACRDARDAGRKYIRIASGFLAEPGK